MPEGLRLWTPFSPVCFNSVVQSPRSRVWQMMTCGCKERLLGAGPRESPLATSYFVRICSISSSDFPLVSGNFQKMKTKPDTQIAA